MHNCKPVVIKFSDTSSCKPKLALMRER